MTTRERQSEIEELQTKTADPEETDMEGICERVRERIEHQGYREAYDMICRAMGRFPDSPVTHNLLGILLEKQGKHPEAMRHFRAACSLEPGYMPADCNLAYYGGCFPKGSCAYTSVDVAANISASCGRQEFR